MTRYLSVCSGIEAASVAWEPLGWKPVAFSEIDRFPSAVLAHRFPTVPNLGDMTKFQEWPDAEIDVLVGGTPCQSFSVAGFRGGLADPRGNLALVYLALAARYRPRWILWENVPGVLSSSGGRDFGSFLGGLGELGYGFAYRVLDAQYFGLAQRRKRVFVVGHLGDWRRAAEVLFEPASLRGDSAPRREAGEETSRSVAPSLGASGRGFSRVGETRGQDPVIVPVAFHNRQDPDVSGDVTHPLGAQDNGMAVAFQEGIEGVSEYETAGSLRANGPGHDPVGTRVRSGSAVRRLTPRECERLQGFPDDWTLIPYRGKPASDGPRYKALGNSMAVPKMRWIGRRIQLSDERRG